MSNFESGMWNFELRSQHIHLVPAWFILHRQELPAIVHLLSEGTDTDSHSLHCGSVTSCMAPETLSAPHR